MVSSSDHLSSQPGGFAGPGLSPSSQTGFLPVLFMPQVGLFSTNLFLFPLQIRGLYFSMLLALMVFHILRFAPSGNGGYMSAFGPGYQPQSQPGADPCGQFFFWGHSNPVFEPQPTPYGFPHGGLPGYPAYPWGMALPSCSQGFFDGSSLPS